MKYLNKNLQFKILDKTSSIGIVTHVKKIVNNIRLKTVLTLKQWNTPKLPVKVENEADITPNTLPTTQSVNVEHLDMVVLKTTTEAPLYYYGALSQRFREGFYVEPDIFVN